MHTMLLVYEYRGKQFWLCPECWRMFYVQHNPFRRKVIRQGNPSYGHTGMDGADKLQETIQ